MIDRRKKERNPKENKEGWHCPYCKRCFVLFVEAYECFMRCEKNEMKKRKN